MFNLCIRGKKSSNANYEIKYGQHTNRIIHIVLVALIHSVCFIFMKELQNCEISNDSMAGTV